MLDAPRLHAALNDLPVALLLAAILFDFLGAVNKRESLKAAAFWCLLGGVIGAALAAVSGLAAVKVAIHGEAARAAMKTHQTLAVVTVLLFGLLLAWRLVRRGLLPRQEQTVFTTAGIIAVGLLIFTAKLGGDLVFSHGAGLDGHALQGAIEARRGGPDHVHEPPPPPATDSARRDSANPSPRTPNP